MIKKNTAIQLWLCLIFVTFHLVIVETRATDETKKPPKSHIKFQILPDEKIILLREYTIILEKIAREFENKEGLYDDYKYKKNIFIKINETSEKTLEQIQLDSLKLISEINRPILLDGAIDDYLGFYNYTISKTRTQTPEIWRDNWCVFHTLCANIKIYLILKKYDDFIHTTKILYEYMSATEIYNIYSYLLISGMFADYINIIEKIIGNLPKCYHKEISSLLKKFHSCLTNSLKTYIWSEKTTMTILLTSVIDSKYQEMREEATKMLLYLNSILEKEYSFFETEMTHNEIKQNIQSVIQNDIDEGIKKYNMIKSNEVLETSSFIPENHIRHLRTKTIPRSRLIYLEQKIRLNMIIESIN
ncbi:MAG: hypothetical protein LBE12_05305 [Planctomycetaceae bacterium]|jgi:hypothetical protein|nr:hypothetical protein [Planctomycetaceae bacterium]